ncbi:uncharacterized protein [Manis javanica]|uniref:uncharacterized protein n=1 Tax=Manis javanica TaxID=9974 RepID=UPI003C6DAB3B
MGLQLNITFCLLSSVFLSRSNSFFMFHSHIFIPTFKEQQSSLILASPASGRPGPGSKAAGGSRGPGSSAAASREHAREEPRNCVVDGRRRRGLQRRGGAGRAPSGPLPLPYPPPPRGLRGPGELGRRERVRPALPTPRVALQPGPGGRASGGVAQEARCPSAPHAEPRAGVLLGLCHGCFPKTHDQSSTMESSSALHLIVFR